MTERAPRLTSAQAAARLNIKLATLYAYVARGLLVSERDESGGSTFDPLAIEAFEATRGRSTRSGVQGRPLMVLDSDLAFIDDDTLYFRGVPATELAATLAFEQAVSFLWNAPDNAEVGFVGNAKAAARRAPVALGPSARLIDRMVYSVVTAGSWDGERDDLRPPAVRAVGSRLIAAVVNSLPDSSPPNDTRRIAERLWAKLSPRAPSTSEIRLMDATMVLSMEHDLAISTVAARVAASARANPYAGVTAALGAFDGAIHGRASVAAVDMLEQTMSTGNAERAIAIQLKTTGLIPGFGHVIYRKEDPRARFLLDTMRPMRAFAPVMDAADRVQAVVAARSPRPANLDLALAVLVLGAAMLRDAGELVFAVSRTAGWIAHMIDEYARPPLRLRPESRYTGPTIELWHGH